MAGNTFGEVFKVTTFGESHGPAIGVVIDGVPPDLSISESDIQFDLDRRRPGQSKIFATKITAPRIIPISKIYSAPDMQIIRIL